MRSAVLAAGVAGLMLGAAADASAQVSKPDLAKAEAAKPDTAKPESAEAAAGAASAAMERAQRMAANPMRVILQASKIRRRSDAEVVPEPVRAGVRNVSTTTVVAAPVPAAVAAPAAPRALPTVAPAPVAVVAALVRAPAPAPTPAEVVAEQLPEPVPAAAPVAAPVAAPAVASAEPAAAPLAAPIAKAAVFTPTGLTAPPSGATNTAPVNASVVAPFTASAISMPPSVAAAVTVQPKLVTMLEPDIPTRLLIEGPRVSEIFADLTLRADGTVAGVALLPGVPRQWQRYVVSALERWRFEPLAAGRVHRVQLVFGE